MFEAMLDRVKCEHAQASVQSDKVFIDEEIKETCGFRMMDAIVCNSFRETFMSLAAAVINNAGSGSHGGEGAALNEALKRIAELEETNARLETNAGSSSLGGEVAALNVWMHMCVDMCIDMFIDMCIDMCMDICIDMCTNLCIDMCTDMRTDMCLDMCTCV